MLFTLPNDGTLTFFPDTQLRHFEHFYELKEAENIFEELHEQIPWRQDPITVFGKTYNQPRLTALFAKNTNPYTYSGITMHPHPMTPLLLSIQKKIATVCQTEFTSVLLNLYRNGMDSNGWHADNEKELGKNPVIASVSFGASRFFHLKHRKIKDARLKFSLNSGSLLIMEGATQQHWLHQIAKTQRTVGPRINLTFRKIL
ncbi:MAG: alpha-ketoglutarate-dependent dioxygenase AlkB [Flavobacteriaceae bacterium]